MMKDKSEINNLKRDGFLKRQTLKTFAGVPLLYADEGKDVLFEGEVLWVRVGKMLLASVQAESSTIEVRIFHPTEFHRRSFMRGAKVMLRGRLTRWHGRQCLVHPRIILR